MIDPALGLKGGQAVRITEGPLTDLEGVFLDIDDQARVAILLSLMGRTVRIQADAGSVEALWMRRAAEKGRSTQSRPTLPAGSHSPTQSLHQHDLRFSSL